jgi:hypothetical protein
MSCQQNTIQNETLSQAHKSIDKIRIFVDDSNETKLYSRITKQLKLAERLLPFSQEFFVSTSSVLGAGIA